MNKYLIFRTDRIGDFLLTAILIKSIKRNESNSHITIVASKKNYNYVKSFDFIDKVILLKDGFFEKIKLISNLYKDKYRAIIIHDQKKRSKFISFFLNAKIKVLIKNKSSSYFSEIKEILKLLNLDFIESDLNTLINRDKYNKTIDKNYILFHFDEKWIHNEYINSYVNIEPINDELQSFINSIINKSSKKLVITTGIKTPDTLNKISSYKFNSKLIVLTGLEFIEIENIVVNCELLISCHGAISHVAAAKNIKQIDIIEKGKLNLYKRWTAHFRSYNFIYRKNFNDLSNDIINML